MRNKGGGLYIHVPFCQHKCLYCDFYSGGVRIADWNLYAKALLSELQERKNELRTIPSTLYFGGGTPSLIPAKEFLYLARDIKRILGKEDEWEEFTIEVNPEDVTGEMCAIWKRGGVTRVSIGLQTLIDAELETIGRKHSASSALNAIETAKVFFERISVDVMFGLPGQTVDSYKDTLRQVVSMDVGHISSYSLMLEQGTAMEVLVRNGKLRLPSEEEWTEMYEITCEHLRNNGYERYEISNYALPSQRSIHNYGYWQGMEYLGLGPGAHSYNGNNLRRSNPTDLKGYLSRYGGNFSSIECLSDSQFYEEEKLTEREIREETVMTRLRTAEGLDLNSFKNKFGEKEKDILFKTATRYLSTGFLTLREGKLSFTDKGFAISDEILSHLI